MITSLYLDTSVYGGYFDIEFKDSTRKLFQRIKEENITVIVSNIVEAEIANAPKHVQKLLSSIHPAQLKMVTINDETKQLANAYISENVVGETSYPDCLHIASATLHQASVLVSWNFKHIVNIDRINGYNSVNLRMGYWSVAIHSPLALENYEQDNK